MTKEDLLYLELDSGLLGYSAQADPSSAPSNQHNCMDIWELRRVLFRVTLESIQADSSIQVAL